MVYLIAVVCVFVIGVMSLRMTPEKLEKSNEKIKDPSKKKSLKQIHNLGKLMIGGAIIFGVLAFV
ncbi:hypothetical protein ACFXIQ_004148 [Vibrio vulnificus]|nr:hypothetical protein [Vibrio vulnificus]MCU8277871.1 hypothetical protein [Vibrio vulnificus]